MLIRGAPPPPEKRGPENLSAPEGFLSQTDTAPAHIVIDANQKYFSLAFAQIIKVFDGLGCWLHLSGKVFWVMEKMEN